MFYVYAFILQQEVKASVETIIDLLKTGDQSKKGIDQNKH